MSSDSSTAHIQAMDAFLNQSLPPLYYEAVCKKLSSSNALKKQILKSFLARKKFFTNVRIRRKPVPISIDFSIIPEYKFEEIDFTQTVSADNPETDTKKTESFESVTDSKPLEPESVSANSEKKRKGRGKGKKQTPPRSVINVLVDDSDIEILNNLAIKQDLSVSYLVRAAIRQYLNFEH
jgi:hypothetical protein